MEPLTIISAQCLPFTKSLQRPFTFSNQTITQRTGFYIQLTGQDGTQGLGEIAPLPGVSPETLKKAKHDAEMILSLIKQWSLPAEYGALLHFLKGQNALSLCCPSVRFGVESAVLVLAAAYSKCTLAHFMGVKDDVASAGLLQGTHDQIIREAREMVQQGVTVFKIKVGSRNIPLDVQNVKDVRAVIGPKARIRLDANRSWMLKEAVLFASLVGLEQIDFIEEPLQDPAQIQEFYKSTHMPVALDETLALMRPGIAAPGRCSPTLANQDGIAAYVIKPTVIGGVSQALEWMAQAKSCGKTAVISAAFETEVSMGMLQALANLSGQVSGLGTGRWFV